MGSFGEITFVDSHIVRKTITEPDGYNLEIAVFEIPVLWYLRDVKGVVRIVSDDFDHVVGGVSFHMERHQKGLFLLDDHEVSEHFNSIVDQLIDTYTTINRMGVSHGDIKPSNVMIDINENTIHTTIIDFGGSRLLPYMECDSRDRLLSDDAVELGILIFSLALCRGDFGAQLPQDFPYKKSATLRDAIAKCEVADRPLFVRDLLLKYGRFMPSDGHLQLIVDLISGNPLVDGSTLTMTKTLREKLLTIMDPKYVDFFEYIIEAGEADYFIDCTESDHKHNWHDHVYSNRDAFKILYQTVMNDE